jgi:predicted transcriptional regulator
MSYNENESMNRSKQEIIAKILDICVKGANKTKIVYEANLNFRTVNIYLDLLNQKELIKVSHGENVIYETTPKGMNLLKDMDRINSEISEIG